MLQFKILYQSPCRMPAEVMKFPFGFIKKKNGYVGLAGLDRWPRLDFHVTFETELPILGVLGQERGTSLTQNFGIICEASL